MIQDVTLSSAMSGQHVAEWLGRPWAETVDAAGTAQVEQMVADARVSGVSAFGHLVQRFPSGLELSMEYTTVRLGGKAGLIAIGRNLLAVAELQSRLIAAQRAMEQDYWKLRDVENRYRLLFDASGEAVLVIGANDLRIIEANPAAIRSLGLAAGGDILPELAPPDRDRFSALLVRVREQRRAPGLLVHLGADRRPWVVRASLMTSDPAPAFLLQLAELGGGESGNAGRSDPVSLEALIQRLPEGFVVLERDGTLRRANRAFLDMVQIGNEQAVLGQRLGRWMSQPGADAALLLATLEKQSTVRLLLTTLYADLGRETPVEVSAAGSRDHEPSRIGVLFHEVSRRIRSGPEIPINHLIPAPLPENGKTSLRQLVREAITKVERHHIEAALERVDGNRTAAAEALGLSRQSLYAKLERYGLEGAPYTDPGARF